MVEMRRFERKEIVDLSFEQEGVVKGQVKDLSPAGARLDRPEGWEKGQEVSFFVHFADWTGFPDIEIAGKVVWLTEKEVGVEFTNFDTLDLDTLNDYYRLLDEQKKQEDK